MVNSETGTSTNNPSRGEYQVFLSFRGPDTRHGFTNTLYNALKDAGIHVFMDDEEFRPGEIISGNLLQGIDDSKLYIPIFSPTYASSHWCLRELAKMVENTSKSKEDGNMKVILPIFYDVKPDDVKLNTPMYRDAILNLEQKMEDQKKKFCFFCFGQNQNKKFSSEDVEIWRQALNEVDGTKGWELEKYLGDGDLCKTVVEEVENRLFGPKEKSRWEELLKALSESPTKDVKKLIRISYDSLMPDQQQIFLDIACFFVGQIKIGPISVWKDCGFRAEEAIDVLVEKSFILVLNGKFWMHDQIRDLGREIANQERTRLWARDDIICDLRLAEIKGSIQALCLRAEFHNPITVTAEQIKLFPHLQFLWLSNVICKGDFAGCLSKLKWISVQYSSTFYFFPEPKRSQGFEATNLPIENLVVVKLFGHEFTVDKVRSLIRGGRKLKVVSYCCDPPEGNPREFD